MMSSAYPQHGAYRLVEADPQRQAMPPTMASGTSAMSGQSPEGEQALRVIQKLIYEVEIDPMSYKYVNAELQKVTFEQWNETIKVNKHIGITMFPQFMRELQKALKLPDEEYLEIVMIQKRMEKGEVKKFEGKFNQGKLDTRYVFFAVHKRGNLTDMVYAMYVLDAKEQLEKVVEKVCTQKVQQSFLWGLFNWETPVYEERLVTKGLQGHTIGRLQQDPRTNAFFRYKALRGFANEGIVDRDRLNLTF